LDKIRRQLTLFVPENESQVIEQVRSKFNPVQNGLIHSHVTLCREDEIENLEAVLHNLRSISLKRIQIRFDNPLRFENGKGVLLPGSKDNSSFHELRKMVLNGIINDLRKHEPHITLMHPRNSTCTDEIFTEIQKVNFPRKISFETITLIEQKNGQAWKTLNSTQLVN
jgi:2'-5' RNA ligase